MCLNFNERTIDYIVKENDPKGCYPYLDDITIVGANQVEHDRNLQAFYVTASKANLTINESKPNFPSLKSHSWGIRLGTSQCNPTGAGYNLY